MATDGEMEMARRKAAGLPPDRAVSAQVTPRVAAAGSSAQGITSGLPAGSSQPAAVGAAGARAQALPGIQAGAQGPVAPTYDQQVRNRAAQMRTPRAAPPPAAAPAPAATTATPRPAGAYGAGVRAGRAARGVAGAITSGAKTLARRAGPLTVIGAAAADQTPTEDYSKRFGLEAPAISDPSITKTPTGKFNRLGKRIEGSDDAFDGMTAGFTGITSGLKDYATRVAGVASDALVSVPDLAIDAYNSVSRSVAGDAATIRPFRSVLFKDVAEKDTNTYGSDPVRNQDIPAGIVDGGGRPEISGSAGIMSGVRQDSKTGDKPGEPRQKSLDERVAAGEIGGYIRGENGREIVVDRAGSEVSRAGFPDGYRSIVAGAQPQARTEPASTARGGAQSIIDGIRSREDSQNADYRNRAISADSERRAEVGASSKNLASLRDEFNSAIFRGERRKAAAIAQAMGVEAGIVSGLKPGAADTRGNIANIDPNSQAEEALTQSQAAMQNLQADKQARVNDLMKTFLDDPNGEAGKAALANLQALEGKQSDQLYPVDFPLGEPNEFGEVPTGRGLVDRSGRAVYQPGQQRKAMPEGAVAILGQTPDGKFIYADENGNPMVDE